MSDLPSDRQEDLDLFQARISRALGLEDEPLPPVQRAALRTTDLAYNTWKRRRTLEDLENVIKAMRAYHSLYGDGGCER